ncbi:5-hydroxytryptamine receptor 3A-like [Dendropsophus ebraccatus]|uniref:5-hydroxytryptamine receptor 3A-like n=1 Tax=Dendropsophus ebraccatus TaxID=150705 RepID=UPI003831886F
MPVNHKCPSQKVGGTCHCENTCSYNDVLQIMKNLPDANVRPVKNWRTPTTVLIDLRLYTIISLDTALETLTSYFWFSMAWKNEFLYWNPEDFCGIEKIFIPNNNIWLPDLYIYEATESDNNDTAISQYLSISYDGTITYSKPLRTVSFCNLDLNNFPFDVQTCTVSFGPYVHTVNEVNMTAKYNSSEVYKNTKNITVSKGDWILQDITVQNKLFQSKDVYYSEVKYQISVRRTPVIYIINLIIPVCFMVILDFASMFIQIGTGERLGFKIAVVLGFSVLLLILNDMLPPSDKPPVLGIFCCVSLAVMVVNTLGSIVTSYMFTLSEDHTNVPPWIKVWIIKRLARVLFFKVKSPKQDKVVSVESAEKESKDENVSCKHMLTVSMASNNGRVIMSADTACKGRCFHEPSQKGEGEGGSESGTAHTVFCVFSRKQQAQNWEKGTEKESPLQKRDKVNKNTETCTTIEMRKTDTQRDVRISVEVKLLKRLLAEVFKIRQEIKYSKDQNDVKSDWYFAAMVVDRLFLIFYLLSIITMFGVVIKTWVT